MSGNISFRRYKKDDGKYRVLLLYLLLNNYDLEKIENVVELEQVEEFGLKFTKIYGDTTEYVDISKIDKDLAAIKTPIICSPQSYEIYSTDKTIQVYKPKIEEKPLYINDMGIISQYMVIDENYVVSNNLAAKVESSDEKGFMFFVDYILKGVCTVGNWEISYQEKEFNIYYLARKDNRVYKQLLYNAIELDLTSSFKLVLYIIRKAVEDMDEFPPDNFTTERWELKD